MSEAIQFALHEPVQAHRAIDTAWQRIKPLVGYSPETGEFWWKARVSQRVKAGDKAGTITHKGYREIKVSGKTFGAHRLAWYLGTGNIPCLEIDHINGIRDDNRLVNLRECTRTLNMQNLRSAPSHNKSSGLLGVSRTRGGTYVAHIKVGADQKHLGTFETAQLAHLAYLEAKRVFHEGCTL